VIGILRERENFSRRHSAGDRYRGDGIFRPKPPQPGDVESLPQCPALLPQKPGSIVLTMRPGPRQGTVELNVIDDGVGIAESLRGHLFEPFFTTASSGTGLGCILHARSATPMLLRQLDYVERPVGTQFSLVCKGAIA